VVICYIIKEKTYIIHRFSFFLIMKLTWAFILILNLQMSASVWSQTTTMSIKLKNSTLQELFTKIEKGSEYRFFYNNDEVDVNQRISVDAEDKTIGTILETVLKGLPYSFKESENKLIVIERTGANLSGTNVQQGKKVTGKVTDFSGAQLPGASVVVKGTTTGIITDNNGNYSLSNIPENAILQFSFVGMKSQEIAVGAKTAINVRLTEETVGIEEVVAIGYGTQRKKDLTGAVAKVDMKEKSTMINVSPVQALRGTVAGVNVTDNGRLGSDGTIVIRGLASISASNTPLIVLDGIPYSGALSDINSNDIESIDILKDASSAAIYGSRSANGVILISTKRGKSEKPLISYNTYYGNSYFGHVPDYSNGPQYVQKILDGRLADGKVANPNDIANYLQPMEVENYKNGKTIKPWQEISQDAPMLNHELNFSGSSNRVNYYVSGSYTDQKGVIFNDKFKRYSFRSNVEATVTDWLKVGINTSYSDRDYSGNEATLDAASYLSPYATLYRDEAKTKLVFFPMNDGLVLNPMINPFYSDNLDKRQNFFINAFTNLKLPYGFSYQSNYANTLNWSKVFNYNRSYSATDEGAFRLGSGSRVHSEGKNWTFENILKWDKTIKNIHTINLTLLYSREHSESSGSSLSSNNIWSDALSYNGLQIGQNPTIGTSAGEDNTVSSMFRLNYRYKDKYLLTVTARRDGFSTFGAGHKYGTFPSLALAWNLSEEKLLKNISWINYLKLRYSYGKNGNQAIGRYASLNKMSTTYYVFGDIQTPTVGLYDSSMANSNLGWESTWASNFGLDFSVLKNRISGAFEYYRMRTEDLLLQRTLPTMNGFNSVWQNIGATQNRGFEATLNTTNIAKHDFSWKTSCTFSTNKNEITKLVGDLNGDGREDDIIASGWFIGQPIGANYDFEWKGIYQVGETMPTWAKPGFPKIVDKNGNGTIDVGDRSVLHADQPDFRFGISNTFSWKEFSLNIFVNSQKGGYRANPNLLLGPSFYNRANTLNIPYWTAENKSDTWPILNFTNPWGQKFYESRSFVRIQDVSLSYTLPPSIINKLKIGSMKLYVSGKNLFTFTKWSNWDPEIGDQGRGDYGPMYRSVIVGLNLTL